MPSIEVLKEQSKFDPSTLLSLFELDARSVNGSRLYFHAGVNGRYEPVVFDGIEYTPFPIEITDVEIDGKGTLPRIKIMASNINGILSLILSEASNLIGAKIIRRKVYARYIDDVNWPYGNNPYGSADPTAAYADEIFHINRKVRENRDVVEFEGVTPLELDNVMLPNRTMHANICAFKYRHQKTCGYNGPPVSDRFGKTFTGDYAYTLVDQGEWSESTSYNQGDYVYKLSTIDQTKGKSFFFVAKENGVSGAANDPMFNQNKWMMDACPHSIYGCKIHFLTGALPYGGFIGLNRGGFR